MVGEEWEWEACEETVAITNETLWRQQNSLTQGLLLGESPH